MNKLLVITVLVVSFLQFGCSSLSKSSYQIPEMKEVTLPNGLKVILIKDKTLPYISMTALVRSGSTQETQTKTGLNYLVANTLTKGTKTRTSLQIASDVEFLGGGLSVDASGDYTLISGDSLSFYKDKILDIYSDVLTQPNFKTAEIRRTKNLMVASIKRSVDEPSNLVEQAFYRQLYKSHPYGRRTLGFVKDVKGLTRTDVVNFYNKYYRPNNTELVVVGNFDDQFLEKIEAKFSGWKSSEVPSGFRPKLELLKGTEVALVEKPNLTQAQIRIGHLGIKRTDPDFIALRVATTILGGSFSSRLMKRVRVEKGLTYGINSRFRSEKDLGSFVVSTFTRNDKVNETINESRDVVKSFVKEGITKRELKDAVALLKGRFPRALETKEKFAYNLLLLRFYGIGTDYLTTYFSKLDGLSVGDVNKAIRKHIRPETVKIVVHASKDVKPQLDKIAPLQQESYKAYTR